MLTDTELTDPQRELLREMLGDADAELQNRLELDEDWDEEEYDAFEAGRQALAALLTDPPVTVSDVNRSALSRAYYYARDYNSTLPVNDADAAQMRERRAALDALASTLGLG